MSEGNRIQREKVHTGFRYVCPPADGFSHGMLGLGGLNASGSMNDVERCIQKCYTLCTLTGTRSNDRWVEASHGVDGRKKVLWVEEDWWGASWRCARLVNNDDIINIPASCSHICVHHETPTLLFSVLCCSSRRWMIN
jgi:hypothetical protein